MRYCPLGRISVKYFAVIALRALKFYIVKSYFRNPAYRKAAIMMLRIFIWNSIALWQDLSRDARLASNDFNA
jgi:hypothetical protein